MGECVLHWLARHMPLVCLLSFSIPAPKWQLIRHVQYQSNTVGGQGSSTPHRRD
jgi:hypothetical protein